MGMQLFSIKPSIKVQTDVTRLTKLFWKMQFSHQIYVICSIIHLKYFYSFLTKYFQFPYGILPIGITHITHSLVKVLKYSGCSKGFLGASGITKQGSPLTWGRASLSCGLQLATILVQVLQGRKAENQVATMFVSETFR